MLKVGLIGCGFMGAMHANCYKNIPSVTLAAVADVRREKAEALARDTGAEIYETGMVLIEKANVDIIDVCLPTYLHAAHAIAAMDKVKYLFVEKPVALTVAEGEAMKEKANATGCQVQVGQVIRFWDEYVALGKAVKSGKYGAVKHATFRRISPRPDWGWQDWLLDSTLSGGAAQDLHIHDVDFVLSLFGEPKAFHSVQSSVGESRSYVNTLLAYDGFPVSVEGTWDLPGCYPFDASFRVTFEKAVMENTGGHFRLYTDAGVEDIKIEKADVGGADVGGNISDLGGYYNELCYFTSCAKEGAPIEKATLADAHASLVFLTGELGG